MLVDQSNHRGIIQRGPALFNQRTQESNGHASVVKLAVPINHAAAEIFRDERRRERERLLSRDHARPRPSRSSREQVINLQSCRVIGDFPPGITGDQELAIVDQVGSVATEDLALVECLADQSDSALREVSHAAVDQLRAPAGRPLGEVVGFQQQRPIASRGRVHAPCPGRSHPRRSRRDPSVVPNESGRGFHAVARADSLNPEAGHNFIVDEALLSRRAGRGTVATIRHDRSRNPLPCARSSP